MDRNTVFSIPIEKNYLSVGRMYLFYVGLLHIWYTCVISSTSLLSMFSEYGFTPYFMYRT